MGSAREWRAAVGGVGRILVADVAITVWLYDTYNYTVIGCQGRRGRQGKTICPATFCPAIDADYSRKKVIATTAVKGSVAKAAVFESGARSRKDRGRCGRAFPQALCRRERPVDLS